MECPVSNSRASMEYNPSSRRSSLFTSIYSLHIGCLSIPDTLGLPRIHLSDGTSKKRLPAYGHYRRVKHAKDTRMLATELPTELPITLGSTSTVKLTSFILKGGTGSETHREVE